MNGQMIVTNLRIDKIDWLQLKTTAAELGMSANEYLNLLIKKVSLKRELAEKPLPYEKLPIWQLDKITFVKKGKGMSAEDKVIYA